MGNLGKWEIHENENPESGKCNSTNEQCQPGSANMLLGLVVAAPAMARVAWWGGWYPGYGVVA